MFFKTDSIIDIVVKAGNLVLEDLEDIHNISTKGFGNYVTEIDYKIEHFLTSNLTKITPGYKFISEESNHCLLNDVDSFWVFDPVDGTTNLIHKYPSICISLALIQNRKPTLGIIYDITSKEIFFAEDGKGSYLNNKKIKVSNVDKLEFALIGYGLPYDRMKVGCIFENVHKVYTRCQDVKRKGPASLDLAYVACGRLDAYFELDLELWDFSAGRLILKEAGGVMTDWHGNELANSKNNIVATNGYLQKELLQVLSF